MSEKIELQGFCDPRFERVRETFAAAFESGAEIGAAVSVIVRGERVVDLWGGWMDGGKTRPWQRDTLVNVFSTTKGMTALCAHRLADQGELDLDDAVVKYWPEFGAEGKAGITVRQLLSHQAGLAAVRRVLPQEALYDWETMTSALAEEKPWWPPGTRHGYHAMTFGWLVGEVVRRITGMSLGSYFRKEIAEPVGADFFIGTGPELDERVAELIVGPMVVQEGPNLWEEILSNLDSLVGKAFMNPPLVGDVIMSSEWRRAEIPAANGHASAAGIATIYGALANGDSDGKRLLTSDAVERARHEQVYGPDAVLPLVTRIANGFMLAPAGEPCGPNSEAFNHAGAGGSLGFCDPEAGIGLGYVMNHMHMGLWLVDPRARALVSSVYEGL